MLTLSEKCLISSSFYYSVKDPLASPSDTFSSYHRKCYTLYLGHLVQPVPHYSPDSPVCPYDVCRSWSGRLCGLSRTRAGMLPPLLTLFGKEGTVCIKLTQGCFRRLPHRISLAGARTWGRLEGVFGGLKKKGWLGGEGACLKFYVPAL